MYLPEQASKQMFNLFNTNVIINTGMYLINFFNYCRYKKFSKEVTI